MRLVAGGGLYEFASGGDAGGKSLEGRTRCSGERGCFYLPPSLPMFEKVGFALRWWFDGFASKLYATRLRLVMQSMLRVIL